MSPATSLFPAAILNAMHWDETAKPKQEILYIFYYV